MSLSTQELIKQHYQHIKNMMLSRLEETKNEIREDPFESRNSSKNKQDEKADNNCFGLIAMMERARKGKKRAQIPN